MKKSNAVISLIVVLVLLAGLGYTAIFGLGSDQSGSISSIDLGLDLAGGVSITYEVGDNETPDAADMADTIYKLQQRAQVHSTESSVYSSGTDRIYVEIPGVANADEILEDLRKQGTLEFQDPDGNTFMTGTYIVSAEAGSYKDQTYGNTQYCVNLVLSDSAADTFAEMTGSHIGERLAIVYDGETISAPTVQSKIEGGRCQIDGMESFEAAENLASYIRIGSLNLSLEELESQIVGASMGASAVQTALIAALIGLLLIMIFMICYYRVPGIAASFALIIYSTLVICVIMWFDITLTLPGIAGVILGIGMAVDANVIIFARIREEMVGGKSVFTAVKDGFKKAQSAILDGNITTLIAAFVLAWRGSGTVKGFAYTLIISNVVSLITALFITRIIMYALYGVGAKNENLYGKAKERIPIGFIAKRKIFYLISAAVIVVGAAFMGVNAGTGNGPFNYSLEFVGGTTTTIEFDDDYTIEEITASMVPIVEAVTKDSDVFVQRVEADSQVIFKTRVLSQEEREKLVDDLAAKFDMNEDTVSSRTVGATISGEMTMDAIIAVVVAVILMLIYIAIRFADIRFATSAILALIHDILIVLTCYAVLRIAVGTTFIAVMLTILGYSINDTIVVFDRIRENLHGRKALPAAELASVCDASVTQTIVRSVNTSLTTFVMVLLLYILGVTSVKDFALPLMVGVVSGTYSSICLATEWWYEMKVRSKEVKALSTAKKK